MSAALFLWKYILQTVSDYIASLEATEVWADVDGYHGYRVSSWGRVLGKRGVLALAYTNGYAHASLSEGPAIKNARVHVLVAKAFLGPPNFIGAVVAHNDGVRSNCRVSNLRWASALENQHDRKRHNTKLTGSRVFGSKLKEAQIPVIRQRLRDGFNQHQVADEFGVSNSTISLISRNHIWKSSGGAAWPI